MKHETRIRLSALLTLALAPGCNAIVGANEGHFDCTDQVKNGQETGEDCGGPACSACPDRMACGADADCASLVCTDGVCQKPSCPDGVKNGSETATDCGGPDCAVRCLAGDGCTTAGDCVTSVCMSGTCQAPSCTDEVKNGDETGEDCGGPVCAARCPTGEGCTTAGDCVNKVCMGGTCQAPSCTDEEKNGSETDKDCGGPTCSPCADGKTCGVAGDCVSYVCAGEVCQKPTCNDQARNDGESDQDCGGLTCSPCADGKTCGGAADCASGVCTGGMCTIATCLDKVKNQAEGDIDCGAICPGHLCDDGKSCGGASDCTSSVCTSGICQAPSCPDGVKNGSETAKDCGGPDCAVSCAEGESCDTAADCISWVCANAVCQTPTSSDGVKNGEETDIDCGGCDLMSSPGCLLCANGHGCTPAPPEDCISGQCGIQLQCVPNALAVPGVDAGTTISWAAITSKGEVVVSAHLPVGAGQIITYDPTLSQPMPHPIGRLAPAMAIDQNDDIYITSSINKADQPPPCLASFVPADAVNDGSVYVAKIDKTGQCVWAVPVKSVGGPICAPFVAAYGSDVVYVSACSSAAQVMFADDPVPLTKGAGSPQNVILAAFSKDTGAKAWARAYESDIPGVPMSTYQNFVATVPNPDAPNDPWDVVITGQTTGMVDFGNMVTLSSPDFKVFSAKINHDGTAQWAWTSPDSNCFLGTDVITADLAGTVWIAAGCTNPTMKLIRIPTHYPAAGSGASLFDLPFIEQSPKAIAADPQGNVLIVGVSPVEAATNTSPLILLTKVDTSMVPYSGFTMFFGGNVGATDEHRPGLAVGHNGNVVLTGSSWNGLLLGDGISLNLPGANGVKRRGFILSLGTLP